MWIFCDPRVVFACWNIARIISCLQSCLKAFNMKLLAVYTLSNVCEVYSHNNLLVIYGIGRNQLTHFLLGQYGDVIMGTIACQINSLTIVYSTVYLDADQRKHLSYVSLAFVWGIQRVPVNSPHKWPVTRKMFPLKTSSLIASSFYCWIGNIISEILFRIKL